MYRVSWDMYKSAVREEEEKVALTPITMFQKRRSPLDTAKKFAKKALEKLAKEYKVDYNSLVRSLSEASYD